MEDVMFFLFLRLLLLLFDGIVELVLIILLPILILIIIALLYILIIIITIALLYITITLLNITIPFASLWYNFLVVKVTEWLFVNCISFGLVVLILLYLVSFLDFL